METALTSNFAETDSGRSEGRCYVLNREKALKKKLSACDRDAVTVQHTGGGIAIKQKKPVCTRCLNMQLTISTNRQTWKLDVKTMVHDKKQRS